MFYKNYNLLIYSKIAITISRASLKAIMKEINNKSSNLSSLEFEDNLSNIKKIQRNSDFYWSKSILNKTLNY